MIRSPFAFPRGRVGIGLTRVAIEVQFGVVVEKAFDPTLEGLFVDFAGYVLLSEFVDDICLLPSATSSDSDLVSIQANAISGPTITAIPRVPASRPKSALPVSAPTAIAAKTTPSAIDATVMTTTSPIRMATTVARGGRSSNQPARAMCYSSRTGA
ncbi:hypothetical protein ACFQH2_10165 [Natronoarchaeum sp. GCM10025703]|uniref:hypothetical protein n=1 Tax=Natronoarchaeum sp. GCM10025703 TaxID=3252685 RepID=UPI00361C6368